jgi:hypothetical protein
MDFRSRTVAGSGGTECRNPMDAERARAWEDCRVSS